MLSRRCSLKAATFSLTAERLGLDNTPNEDELTAMRLVAERVYEPLRDEFGDVLIITSFFRSEKVNRKVGGSKSSDHRFGRAIDLELTGHRTNTELFEFVRRRMQFDQLIWEFGTIAEPAWVHVGYRDTISNRQQVLRATRVTNWLGKPSVKYEPFYPARVA